MTPTEFRTSYDEWSKSAPANDSDVIPPAPRKSVRPRHADLSKEIDVLLLWRHISATVEPLSTNWMAPDNDNFVVEDDEEPRTTRSMDCHVEVRPSLDEIEDAIDTDDVEYGAFYKNSVQAENGSLLDDVRPIVRIGTLRFHSQDSDGSRWSPTRGSLIRWDAGPDRLGFRPVENYGEPKGPSDIGDNEEDIERANLFFAELLNAAPHRYVQSSPKNRRKLSDAPRPPLPSTTLSLSDARKFCKLHPLPHGNDNRAALPSGSRAVSDSFVGHHRPFASDSRPSGEIPEERLIRMEESKGLRAQLSRNDARALDLGICAANFSEIGEAYGYKGKTAERQGKQHLLTACKNLSALLTA